MADNTGNNKKKPSFLVIYAAGLLTIALVLVILSYFQQKRANEQLGNLQAQHDIFSTSALQSIDEMRDALIELDARNHDLESQIADLQNQNSALNSENEELKNSLNISDSLVADLEQQNKALEDEISALKALIESNEEETTEE